MPGRDDYDVTLARWQGEMSADMKNIKRSTDELRDSQQAMAADVSELREEWASAKGAGRLAGGIAGLFGAGAIHLLTGWFKK